MACCEGAVRHANRFAPVVILSFVPRVVPAEADPALRERQDRSRHPPAGSSPVSFRSPLRRSRSAFNEGDGHPRAQAGIRALPVIGVAAALSKTQTVDVPAASGD